LVPGAMAEKSVHLARLDMSSLVVSVASAGYIMKLKVTQFFSTFLLFPLSWAQPHPSALQKPSVCVPLPASNIFDVRIKQHMLLCSAYYNF